MICCENCPRGQLIVISGPSGVGKGTVVSLILKSYDGFTRSKSLTTRPRRDRDPNDTKYEFCDRETFNKRFGDGDILERTEYGGNYYGTIRSDLEKSVSEGKNVLLEIDVNGALQIKKLYPYAILICLLPDRFSDLITRLRTRGTEDPENMKVRLDEAKKEITYFHEFDYVVVNSSGKAAQAAEEIVGIVHADSLRTVRHGEFYNELLNSLNTTEQLSISD
ncbi:MAG: guanylate kinase [Clostridiales bacterium]|jgi:guanylate kinase|nr:guanylate kinase [Clostridiales bacterium]